MSSTGRLGGSTQEFVIAAQLVFRDLELGQGRQTPWWPQAVVLAQSRQGQFAAAELPPEVSLHTGQVVLLGGDMEGIDHHLGGLIRWQGRQQLAPQLPPALAWQEVVLQLSAQQGPGLTPQALDHMAEINAPQCFLALLRMQPRQGFNELAAQEQIQPVMAQVHRELLADQP
jgi:hypothetical protein